MKMLNENQNAKRYQKQPATLFDDSEPSSPPPPSLPSSFSPVPKPPISPLPILLGKQNSLPALTSRTIMHDFVREDVAIDAEKAMARAAFVATAFAHAVGNESANAHSSEFLLLACVC